MKTEKPSLDLSAQSTKNIIDISKFLSDETSYIRLNPNNTDTSPLSIKPYIESRKLANSRMQRKHFEPSVYDATPENISIVLAIVGMTLIFLLSKYESNLLIDTGRLIKDNISNVTDFVQNSFSTN